MVRELIQGAAIFAAWMIVKRRMNAGSEIKEGVRPEPEAETDEERCLTGTKDGDSYKQRDSIETDGIS